MWLTPKSFKDAERVPSLVGRIFRWLAGDPHVPGSDLFLYIAPRILRHSWRKSPKCRNLVTMPERCSGGERPDVQRPFPPRRVLARERLHAHDLQPHVFRDGVQAELVWCGGGSIYSSANVLEVRNHYFLGYIQRCPRRLSFATT